MDKHTPVFLYTVNTYKIGQHFIDVGKQDKYYEYNSKNFYGAVIKSPEPIENIESAQVILIVRSMFSNGSFKGVKIDLIPKDDKRIAQYSLSSMDLTPVRIQVKENPGNIVINETPSLTSLFFHDSRGKRTTIINFTEV